MSAFLYSHNFNFAFFWSHFIKNIYSLKKKKDIAHKRSEIQAEKCTDSWLNGIKFSQLKRLTVLFSGLSQTLRGIFVGPRSFSYFSAQGSEKGGEAEPTHKRQHYSPADLRYILL